MIKELKERGYKFRVMTLKQANQEVTSSQAKAYKHPNQRTRVQAASLTGYKLYVIRYYRRKLC